MPATSGVSRIDNVTYLGRDAPAWLLRDPVYQAAMLGQQLLGEGQGLTPEELQAADKAAAAASGTGQVKAAASPGTIIYWVYGSNSQMDSGPSSCKDCKNVVDFSAK